MPSRTGRKPSPRLPHPQNVASLAWWLNYPRRPLDCITAGVTAISVMRMGLPSGFGLIARRVTVFRPSRMARTMEVLNRIGLSVSSPPLNEIHQIHLHRWQNWGKELVQHIRSDQAGVTVHIKQAERPPGFPA